MPSPPHPSAGFVLRPVREDELETFFRSLFRAFGEQMREGVLEHELVTTEVDRTLAAFDGDTMVGTAGIFSFDLAVPGGRLPAAGVTLVSVAATHRRRGALSAMMDRQLADIHERGEPVAVLWASEGAIYGRFGYGVASRRLQVEVDRVDASPRRGLPDDRELDLQLLPTDRLVEVLEQVDLASSPRPGSFHRDSRWRSLLTHDPEWRRNGFTELQCVVAARSGRPEGYLLYRTKAASTTPYGLADGDLQVVEQQAVTPAAEAALLRYVLGMDLMRRVRWWNLPVDTALPYQLSDPRQARVTWLDALHLRVVDLPVALAARRYAAPVDVVLEVADARCPWNTGRWRLRGDRAAATCEPTGDSAQLRLDAETLGAAYLGGTPLSALAAAGRVGAADDAVLRATSTAFGWDPQPWCPVVF